jgi:hypothetical protein
MIILEKNVLFDQRKTALDPIWEVARNSPEGEQSIDRGAFLNLNQSIREPVTISHTLTHLSRLEQRSHL